MGFYDFFYVAKRTTYGEPRVDIFQNFQVAKHQIKMKGKKLLFYVAVRSRNIYKSIPRPEKNNISVLRTFQVTTINSLPNDIK